MATKQRSVDHSTEQEVTPSQNQQIITESQKNSSVSLSGGVNRRRVDQNLEREKQDNSSVPTPSVSKHTEQVSTEETANAVRRPRRRKRGISDNEVDLPDDDMEQSNGDLAPFAGYANLLHGPTSQQRVSPASTIGSIYIKHEDTDELPDSVFNTIRQTGNTREKRRNGRVRGRKRKQSSLLTLLRQPDKFNDTQQSASGDMCKKKRLQVNFNDIGWGEWVIAPQFFDAFYCGGFCSFPISRKLRPTNHATIQSIVQAVGVQGTDVPSPCCVPASLTSLTLLYFDHRDNVVLKNFPDMSVKSCACR